LRGQRHPKIDAELQRCNFLASTLQMLAEMPRSLSQYRDEFAGWEFCAAHICNSNSAFGEALAHGRI
jgi:hypothetical protein